MKDKIAHLKKVDPVLAAVIKRTKLRDYDWTRRQNHFKALVVAIVNQQLLGQGGGHYPETVCCIVSRKALSETGRCPYDARAQDEEGGTFEDEGLVPKGPFPACHSGFVKFSQDRTDGR